jgi:hypothetical protein
VVDIDTLISAKTGITNTAGIQPQLRKGMIMRICALINIGQSDAVVRFAIGLTSILTYED